MAERRRRRQARSSQEILSEGESQQADDLSLSASEHNSENEYVDMSEFDSAEEDGIEDEITAEKEFLNDKDVGKEYSSEDLIPKDTYDDVNHDGSGSDDGITRESGDGKSDNDQEVKTNKKVLKISEDRSSPFFIPTKGNFYQHDVRSEESRGSRGRGGRSIRSDFSKEKWLHDKYDESEQAPKTSDELIDEYGYDIRSKLYSRPTTNSVNRRGGRGNGLRGMSRGNVAGRNDRYEGRIQRNSSPPRSSMQSSKIRSRDFHARKRSFSPERNNLKNRPNEHSDDSIALQSTSRDPSQKHPNEEDSSGEVSSDISTKPNPSNLPSSMNSVLDVINNRERGKPSSSKERSKFNERTYPQQRNTKPDSNLMERVKNLSIQKESGPPKRYSSLRQRVNDPPTNPPRHSSRHALTRRPQRFSANPPAEWLKQSSEKHDQPNVTSLEGNEGAMNEGDPSSLVPGGTPQPPLSSSTSRTNEIDTSSSQTTVTTAALPSDGMKLNGSTQSNEATALAQLQWYEAALAYQQVLSQSLLTPATLVPQQNAPHDPNSHTMGDAPLLLNNEHPAPSPPQLPMVPQTLGQGDLPGLNSLVYPPPMPQDFQASNIMQRNINVVPERNVLPPSMQLPFSPTPNLMAQQVGGVTYYPNHVQPMQNVHNIVPGNPPLSSSPMRRLNAAIPIRHPME